MSGACSRCDGITPERVAELEAIGGSHYPFSEPWGELRSCPACGARFIYQYDHDNELGYVADPSSLKRVDDARVKRFVEEATAAARRLLEHFAPLGDAYSARVASEYREELKRLALEARRVAGG